MISAFRNLKISRKIPLSIAIFIALPMILSVISMRMSGKINAGGQEIYDNYFISVVNLTDARKQVYEELVWLKSHIISPDDQAMLLAERNIENASNALDASMSKFENTLDPGEETRLFNEFKYNIQQLRSLRDTIITLSQDNEDVEADQLASSQYREQFNTIQKQIEGMFKTNVDGAETYYKSNQSTYNTATNSMLTLAFLVTAIGIFIGWLLVTTIQLPLVNAKRIVRKISRDNDLSITLPVDGDDEITELSVAFNDMMESLKSIIEEMSQAVGILKDESGVLINTVGSSENDLNHSSTILDQVQNSTAEITYAIEEIAQGATNASSEANRSNNEAQAGLTLQGETVQAVEKLKANMGNASETISGLSTDSDAIGSVLDVIRGIAEQTNLLALNAAIEAARAGEQGRGFAVVADEVRSLAQRTQESTSEIQGMIEKLQQGAQSSVDAMTGCISSLDTTVDLTNRSEKSLTEISQTIQNILRINDTVASATEEQSATVKEITHNVDTASQSAKHTSSSFESLKGSSERLLSVVTIFEPLIGKFKIGK